MTKINKRDWINEFDPTDKGRLHYNFQKSDPNIYNEHGEPVKVISKLSQIQKKALEQRSRGRAKGNRSRWGRDE